MTFIGREKEIKYVCTEQESKQIIGVYGRKGIGKTSLVKFASKHETVDLLTYDFRGIRSFGSFFEQLCEDFGLQEYCPRFSGIETDDEILSQIDSTKRKIFKKIHEQRNKRAILFLDNLESAQPKTKPNGSSSDRRTRNLFDRVYEFFLKPLLEHHEPRLRSQRAKTSPEQPYVNFNIIITSETDLKLLHFRNNYTFIELQPLISDDSNKLLKVSSECDICEETIETIIDMCDGIPMNIIRIGEYLKVFTF